MMLCCRLALQNTRLIKLVCDIDPRVQPLMFNVRYWAKLKGLAGGANGQTSITNYALTMMVIFYLQQLDLPVVPSVEQLAKLANGERVCSVTRGLLCDYSTFYFTIYCKHPWINLRYVEYK